MAKTKTPFLSLGSSGTVGGSLTSQKRGTATLLREKPVPTDPYSLPQAYQRWLYEDYAYRWTQQSQATKQTYATAGSRYHLTGLQYWLKYQLTNLPDICSGYHLDNIKGATAIDFSRNARHGTVLGASVTPGRIHNGLLFDGLNDIVNCPAQGILAYPFTMECFVRIDALVVNHFIMQIANNTVDNMQYAIYLRWTGFPTISANNPAITWAQGTTNITDGQVYHLAGVFLSDTVKHLYVNGVLEATAVGNVTYNPAVNASSIGGRCTLTVADWLDGMVDEARFYNRALDVTELLRHAERRYSL